MHSRKRQKSSRSPLMMQRLERIYASWASQSHFSQRIKASDARDWSSVFSSTSSPTRLLQSFQAFEVGIRVMRMKMISMKMDSRRGNSILKAQLSYKRVGSKLQNILYQGHSKELITSEPQKLQSQWLSWQLRLRSMSTLLVHTLCKSLSLQMRGVYPVGVSHQMRSCLRQQDGVALVVFGECLTVKSEQSSRVTRIGWST